MRIINIKKADVFQIKSIPTKSANSNQSNMIKRALEEAKRQAYSDMGFNF